MEASEYKKLASAKQVLEDLTLPSGAVFKMRPAPIQQWVATGILPASLTAKMQETAKRTEPAEANDYVLNHFTEQDFVDSQNMSKRLLEYCAVEPKISTLPLDKIPDGAIATEDLLPEDFEAVMKWIWSGGRQGETLANFCKQEG